MKEKIEQMLRIVVIAGMAILLLSVVASAETARQQVVKEACYALDGGQDYTCGRLITMGNKELSQNILMKKNNPEISRLFFVDNKPSFIQ